MKVDGRWERARLQKLFLNAETMAMREIITFQCTECKNRNYSSTKNKKTTTERLEMKKFCRKCRKHQAHKEIK